MLDLTFDYSSLKTLSEAHNSFRSRNYSPVVISERICAEQGFLCASEHSVYSEAVFSESNLRFIRYCSVVLLLSRFVHRKNTETLMSWLKCMYSLSGTFKNPSNFSFTTSYSLEKRGGNDLEDKLL